GSEHRPRIQPRRMTGRRRVAGHLRPSPVGRSYGGVGLRRCKRHGRTDLTNLTFTATARMSCASMMAGDNSLAARDYRGRAAPTQTIFKVPIEAYETAAYRRVANGFRNPRRVRDALLRISFLTLSIVLCYPMVFVYTRLRAYIHVPLQLLLLSYALIVLTTIV